MPHFRLNTKGGTPNPYFNFISALPSFLNAPGLPSQQNAKELLDALAAQVRPVCKKHGFDVNSFEEYEHNSVFLGRNWNAGETIEIVLRRSDGAFHDVQQLIQVVCHELAHIKHMNHQAGFQQLNAQLCHEVAALRTKGYFGDGMYSSGSRLSDSAEVAGRGLGATGFDLPEYMCGGAQQRQRASTLRRGPRQTGPRAQKSKRRKAGTRVTSKYAFEGQGQALNAHVAAEEEKKKGTGFRKSTQSAKERQARLEATEKRLRALQQHTKSDEGQSKTPSPTANQNSDEDEDSDRFEETDESRRKLLADSGAGWKFNSVPVVETDSSWDDNDILNLISDDDETPSPSAGSSRPPRIGVVGLGSTPVKPEKRAPGLANIVRDEVEHRKRERLGLVGERKLGGANLAIAKSRLLGPGSSSSRPRPTPAVDSGNEGQGTKVHPQGISVNEEGTRSNEWACLVCTCLNHNDYGICQACATRRGSSALLSH